MFIRSTQNDDAQENMLDILERFNSQSAQNVVSLIRQAANTDSSVIITGEVNTGKRWTAQCIHFAGRHAQGPFYEVSCLALTNDRIQRELFGHLTYTPEGIEITHKVFKEADGGTLLIDAFTLLPTEMQLHLVSIMEQISTQQVINQNGDLLDVQLILTLDNESYSMVKEEPFWKGLIERINPLYLHEPPLRERREDIPVLIEMYLERLSDKYQVARPTISLDAMHKFIQHDWPGNLRQLQNAVEYALILSESFKIKRSHLPKYMLASPHSPDYLPTNGAYLENHSLLKAERNLFKEAVRIHKDIDLAAKRLGVRKGTLVHRLGPSSPFQK